MTPSSIGESVVRGDGEAKVRGRAVYGMDLAEPGMLSVAVRRADTAAARVIRIDATAARRFPGVHAIATGADVPHRSGKFVVKDQTMFALDRVRYVGEPLAAVAAETAAQAAAAAASIEVELELLKPVLDLDTALDDCTPLVHPDWADYITSAAGPRGGNLAWESRLDHGDPDAAFSAAHLVVSDEFRVPRQHQCPIEPHVAIARYDDGKYTLHTSSQQPYLAQARVAEFLQISPAMVRVIVPTVGGAFGGKIDALLEPIVCLMARLARRPVRLINSRAEEFATTGPRENAVIRLRTAVDVNGCIQAQEAHIVADNGAYSSGETVACTGVAPLALGGTYFIPSIRYISQVVYTNSTPTAAFRGIGGVYSVFAQELHLDRIARAIGIDRRELRLRNVIRPDQQIVNGQVMRDAYLIEALQSVERRAPWDVPSSDSKGPLIGKAIVPLTWITNPGPSEATARLTEDGRVVLSSAGVEIGTGALVAGIRQLVAEEVGMQVEDILLIAGDTDAGGYDQGAQGSRTVYGLGNASIEAARGVRAQITSTAAEMLEVSENELELADGRVWPRNAPARGLLIAEIAARATWTRGPISAVGRFAPPRVQYSEERLTGAVFTHFNAASYHAHFAEVEVDPDTGQVAVSRYVVAQDVGRIINPVMLEGQVHGGVAQGIGYALFEDLRSDASGTVLDVDLEHYRIPTALDIPPIDVEFLENACASGPAGAKGAGEPPIVPVAAVIACAVADAIGQTVYDLPLTPDKVLAALQGQKQPCRELRTDVEVPIRMP